MDRKVAAGLVKSANRRSTPTVKPSPYAGLIRTEDSAKQAADLNQGERMQLAKEGKALPDGSFPIRNATDLA
jgi:hypothetical protein